MIASKRIARVRGERLTSGLIAVSAILLCLTLFPLLAQARTFEGVGTFGGVLQAGEVSEESQLAGVASVAVNYSGAGGVAKGTVYVLTQNGSAFDVGRFAPAGGGLKFVERWRVIGPSAEADREKEGKTPYEICGPAVVAEGLEGVEQCSIPGDAGRGTGGVAVNQVTGNVYVAREAGSVPEGQDVLAEYTANGAKLITRFGEQGPLNGHLLDTPEKIHFSTRGLAVNDEGEVFYFDYDSVGFDNFYHRLMVFKPKTPGNFTDYEYAGVSRDIGAGFLGETNFPMMPALDDQGNVYVTDARNVEMYDPSVPSKPACTFAYPASGIQTLTVDPASGEPFFYTYLKKPRRIHQLSGCENGSFHETGEIDVAPERAELTGLSFDPVRQQSAGSEPGTLYGVAPGPVPDTGKGEPGTSALGYIFGQPGENAPLVGGLEASSVTQGSSVLKAQVDPQGFVTHYSFRYLTKAEYQTQGESFVGAPEKPFGGASLSPAGGERQVEAMLSDLEPDTDYVFQVIASSNCSSSEPAKICSAESATALFHTYAPEAQGLPDRRAYEMVSPPEKQGGQVLPLEPLKSSCSFECKPGETAVRFPLQSSASGDAVVFEGEPFGPNGALIENEYISRRTAEGWTTENLTPTLLINRDRKAGYTAFDPELTTGILKQGPRALTDSTPGEFTNLYAQTTAKPASLSALLTSANASPTCQSGNGQGSLEVVYSGASTDLSRIFFEANDVLVPGSGGVCGNSNLYEWTAGMLRAVNIPPGGGASTPGAVFGSGSLLRSGSATTPVAIVTHAISSDGDRTFFTGADGHLYVRVGGSETLQVPGPGTCNQATPLAERACFLAASPDGSVVMLSDGRVYSLDEAGTAYEPSVDLAQGQGGFEGAAGHSEDLDHIYFVDTANLTGSEENDQGSVAQAGSRNLYSWTDEATRFVARLSASDGGGILNTAEFGDWADTPLARSAEASPAGRWLAFESVSSLTGYENVGVCKKGVKPNPYTKGTCKQVYLYDSQTGSLVCPSCNPSGARPVGQASLSYYRQGLGHLSQPRYLTDAGRLFFDSGDQLVPGDTNGHVEDVYEYEPDGVGDCSGSKHCLRLISAGRGSTDSNFLTMDPSGDNVFFTTGDALVDSDRDELIDLYDARVGGGLEPSQPPTQCRGEACQQVAPSPQLAAPQSMGVAPEGKPKPGASHRCRKGQVKRNRHCVKKQKSKAQKHHKQAKRQARRGSNR